MKSSYICMILIIWFNLNSTLAVCNSQCVKPPQAILSDYDKDIETMKQDLQQKFKELHQRMQGKQAPNQSNNEPLIKVFVSASLPKLLLSQLAEEAKVRFPGKVIFLFRGIKNNDFRSFIQEVAVLADSGFVIDPEAFVKYQVEQVPTFIVGTESCYDRLVGATSIKYVLRYIADNNGEAKEFAARWLDK